MTEEKGLETIEAAAFPIRGIEDAIAIHDRFVELKQRLIAKVDGIDKIAGSPYVNRQGWLSTATAFGVSVAIVESGIREIPGTDPTRPACRQAWARVRASKGSRSFEAEGTCDTSEDWSRRGNYAPDGAEGASCLYRRKGREYEQSWHFPKTWNALIAFAQTRGMNRAIGGLLGLSEISAEEAIGVDDTGEGVESMGRREAGAREIGGAPKPSSPKAVSGAEPPRDVVGDIFKLQEKLVNLVGTDGARRAKAACLMAAGIATGTSLYRSTKIDPKTPIATREEQIAFWRAYKAEVEAAEARIEAIGARGEDEDGIPDDEKGVAE